MVHRPYEFPPALKLMCGKHLLLEQMLFNTGNDFPFFFGKKNEELYFLWDDPIKTTQKGFILFGLSS